MTPRRTARPIQKAFDGISAKDSLVVLAPVLSQKKQSRGWKPQNSWLVRES